MNLFKTLRSSRHAGAEDDAAPPLSEADATLTGEYEHLDERDAIAGLTRLNQEELGAIETFERCHRERAAVLNKLRYLQQAEPFPGYDGLEPSAIADAVAAADLDTVKAVREYERKLLNRPAVMAAVAVAVREQRGKTAADDDPPAPEQPFVVGNGVPAKTKPEQAL